MKIYRIAKIVKTAVADGEFRDLRDKVDRIKDDIRDGKKDYRDLDSRLKKVEKQIDELNIGHRRYWQEKTVFTSLQRKLEQMEKMEQEWIRYKDDLEDNIKKQIEQNTRASIRNLAPKR